MIKRSKLVYIIGSIVIGIISVVFVFAGLVFSGVIDNSSRKLVLKSADADMIYNGTALVNEYTELVEGTLKDGHTLTTTVLGSQTNAGSSENKFTATVYDANGADVSGDYEIEYNYGTLLVNPNPISITAGSVKKEYDGTPLVCQNDNFKLSAGALVEGDVLTCTISGTTTDAGKVDSVAAAKIVTAEGEDVTANYAVTYITGTIEVTKKPIGLISGDSERPYDGKPLVCEEYKIFDGGVVEGHEIIPTYYGTLTEAGEAKNEFKAAIKDANGADVTANYEIEYKTGKLLITPYKTVRIRTGDAHKTYDGTPLSLQDWNYASGYENVFTDAFAGYTMEVDCSLSSITDVGELDNEPVYEIKNAEGKVVTDSFNVIVEKGKLEVYPYPLEIKTGSKEKTYDGTPLNYHYWEWINGNPFNDQTANPYFYQFEVEIKCTGSQTNAYAYDQDGNVTAGVSKNTAELVSVLDTTGRNITKNFELKVSLGELCVNPRKVNISTAGKEKIYDGLPLSASTDATVKSWWPGSGGDGVLPAHNLVVKFKSEEIVNDASRNGKDQVNFGWLINAGECENTITWDIYDREDGTQQSLNYSVSITCGKLVITPAQLTIASEGKTKHYDREPLTYDAWKITSGGLVSDTHELLVTVNGECTEVNAVVENTFAWQIVDENGEDISKNYKVQEIYGELTITPRPIVLSANSYTKTYNGSPLTGKPNGFEKSNVLEGDVVTVTLTGSVTDVCDGPAVNAIASWLIEDADGNDVTDYYAVSCETGTLTVTPRLLRVSSSDRSKAYDGTPLTDTTPRITALDGYGLVSGHKITVVITGSQTEAGESENTIESCTIVDANGVDMLDKGNYDITTSAGTLVVYPASSSGEEENPFQNDGGGNIGKPDPDLFEKVIATVEVSETQRLYLRLRSEGDYTGRGWNASVEYPSLLSGAYSANYLTGRVLAANGFVSTRARIEIIERTLTGYLLPTFLEEGEASLYEVQTSDVRNNGSTAYAYTTDYYNFFYQEQGGLYSGLLGDWTDDESAYAAFVEENYLQMTTESARYFGNLVTTLGWTKDTDDIVKKVASHVRNCAKYNMEYDDELDAQADIAVAFHRDYGEGICQHYATTATMIFRALGIPARYTVGYVAEAQANTTTEVKGKMAHAWVEVYLDGVGWVNVEVTGSDGSESDDGSGDSDGGNQNTNTNTISVYPVSLEKKYDGTPLVSTGAITGNDNFRKFVLNKGYTPIAVVESASRTEAGRTAYKITALSIYDGDTDITSQFKIDMSRAGYLHVYLYELTVTTESSSRPYNGLALTAADYTHSGEIAANHKLLVSVEGKQVEVGSSANRCAVQVVDENDEVVTDQYKINRAYGTLTVTPCELTIETDSLTVTKAELTAMGGTLTCNSYTLVGTLAEGHRINVVIDGSLSTVGRAENTVQSVSVRTTEGVDVTSNYSITYVLGTLRVTAK